MSRRIHCAWHPDATPSMYLYPDGGFCFVCGKKASLEELGKAPAEIPEVKPEDLESAVDYIESLPLKSWRGLQVPMDEDSAFILWPDGDYYKRRLLRNEKVRYLSPSGHRKPWFWAREEGSALVVVEGEINALSIAAACPDLAVVSPGGAGDFSSQAARKYCTILVLWDTILIVADADAPGAKAVIDLYGELAGRVPTVKTLLMPTDANDLLVQRGQEALRQEIERAVAGSVEKGP